MAIEIAVAAASASGQPPVSFSCSCWKFCGSSDVVAVPMFRLEVGGRSGFAVCARLTGLNVVTGRQAWAFAAPASAKAAAIASLLPDAWAKANATTAIAGSSKKSSLGLLPKQIDAVDYNLGVYFAVQLHC